MDLKKIQKFNDRMARPKYSKGGYIKKIAGRKYFDDGGVTTPSTAVTTPTPTQSTTVSPQMPSLGTVGTNYASLNFPNLINNAGSAVQGIASDFTAQNGYNANVAPTTELNYTPTISGSSTNAGTNSNQFNANLGNEENLAGTLNAESQGAGPNPAQAQLNQNTATNVANQAALAAGQRGGSANVGLQTRQAAQTGANAQQQAVGQEATTQATQNLGEQQTEASVLGNAGTQATGEQNANTNLFGAAANANNAQNNTNVSNYGMAQGINSQVAQSNANAVNNTTSGLLGGGASLLSSLNKGGEIEKPSVNGHKKLEFLHKIAKMGMEHFDKGTPDETIQPQPTPSSHSWFGPPSASADTTPATPPSQNVQNAQQSMDSAFGGRGNYDNGGVAVPAATYSTPNLGAAQTPGVSFTDSGGSSGGKSGGGGAGIMGLAALMSKGGDVQSQPATSNLNLNTSVTPDDTPGVSGQNNYASGGDIFKVHPTQMHAHISDHFQNYFAKGGESKDVPAMVSPNEVYLDPEAVENVKHGADPFKVGYKIPGKDKVKGKDSLKNDTVPMTLREGGVVVPLHVAKTKDPDKARLFTLKSLRSTGKHMKRPKGMS